MTSEIILIPYHEKFPVTLGCVWKLCFFFYFEIIEFNYEILNLEIQYQIWCLADTWNSDYGISLLLRCFGSKYYLELRIEGLMDTLNAT